MSSASSLKEELFKLKTRLETIEEQLTSQSDEIDRREGKWSRIEPNLNYVVSTQGDRVRLNIGGIQYTTSVSTIMSIPDSFLARLIDSNRVDLKEEIFIERSPKVFPAILDYYRYKKIDYKRFTREEILLLRDDSDYYAISDISNFLEEKLKDPFVIAVETGGDYIYEGKVAGTNKASDLNNPDTTTGVCSCQPGKVIVELNSEYEIQGLEIAGYTGNTKIWYPDNGSGAKIYTSVDKKDWTHVGQIPSGFGKGLKQVKLTKVTSAKYVKFELKTFVGMGYIKFTKVDQFTYNK